MRISLKIFPGVRISGSTRRRRKGKRAPAWTHEGCSIRHRTQDAAQRCTLGRTRTVPTSAVTGRSTQHEPPVDTTKAARDAHLDGLAARVPPHRPPPGPEYTYPYGKPPDQAKPTDPLPKPPRADTAPSVKKSVVIVQPEDHLPGWSYLYLGAELKRGLEDHEAEYLVHEQRLISPNGDRINDPQADFHRRLAHFKALLDRSNEYFNDGTLAKAFGAGGEGDAETVRYVAEGIVGIYVSMMQWAVAARSVVVQQDWAPIFHGLAEMPYLPVRQIRQFSADWATEAEALVNAKRSGLPHKPTTVTLKLSISDDAMARLHAAFTVLHGA